MKKLLTTQKFITINNQGYKRLLATSLTLILITMSLMPQPRYVQANPALVAAGGVEIGALALWGGAALVAATGVAVGMDKELMAEVEAWGANAYNSAHDAIKSSISTSTALMAAGWDTANRYAVTWSDATLDYLKNSWDNWFGGKTDIGVIGGAGVQITNDVISNFANFNAYIVPSRVTRPTQDSLSNIGVWADGGTPLDVRNIYVDEFGRATIYFSSGTYAVYRNKGKIRDNNEPFLNAMEAWLYFVVGESTFIFNGYSVAPVFEDMNTVNPAGQYVPISFPQTFPRTVVLPAPGGVLDADGNVVQRRVPTIGTVGGVQGGEIAVGYPTVAGDFGALTQADAITSDVPIDVPVTPWVPTVPNVDWPDKLRVAVTTRFPFSLPWDVAHLVNLFVSPPEVPEFRIKAGQYIDFTARLDKIDPYMPFFRAFLIASFLWGLVLNTRRLLGGSQ